jgi:hypothetical protein
MRCNHEKTENRFMGQKTSKRPKTRLKTNQQPSFQCFSEDVSENLFEDHRNAEDGRLPAGLRLAVGLFGSGGGRSPLKPAVSVSIPIQWPTG